MTTNVTSGAKNAISMHTSSSKVDSELLLAPGISNAAMATSDVKNTLPSKLLCQIV